MDTAKLQANNRDESGRGACHRLRRNHFVPGILYGRGRDNVLVEFSEMDIDELVKKYGEHAVVELNINGSNVKTMIKEIQRDPLKHNIRHVDMKFVNDGEKVHVDVPILLRGEEMIKSKGGVVQKQISTLSVEADPDKIPKVLVADISKLNIGDKLTLADAEFSSELSIADDKNSIIAVITSVKEKDVVHDDSDRQPISIAAVQKSI